MSLAPPAAGDRVAHYRIERELGRGGMSIVYHAIDERSGRAVALKAPRTEDAADMRALRDLLREVRLAARLVHPHIVATLGAFEHGAAPWLVMEYVEGRTLGEVLRAHGPLAPGEVRRHGAALAGALAFAHRRGVLHQDVTPNNVLLGADGRARLGDFGLARVVAAPRGLAARRRGGLCGTPAYLSPEQVQGLPPDERSDVFALGAVLYEMCTGRPPFDAPSVEATLDAIASGAPAPRLDAIPADLADVIAYALVKDRAARLPDMGVFAEALCA